MRVTRGIAKGINSAIKSLTKIFGITSKVYKPIKFNDPAHGYFDSNIEWEQTPIYEGKLLAPFIFKKKEDNLDIISSFLDDDQAVYTTTDYHFPRHSLIVMDTKWGKTSYIISDIKQIRDDERIILTKYFVVPDKEFRLPRDKDTIESKLEKPLPEWYVDEDIITEDDNIDTSNNNSNDLVYKPVE